MVIVVNVCGFVTGTLIKGPFKLKIKLTQAQEIL